MFERQQPPHDPIGDGANPHLAFRIELLWPASRDPEDRQAGGDEPRHSQNLETSGGEFRAEQRPRVTSAMVAEVVDRAPEPRVLRHGDQYPTAGPHDVT